MKKRMLIFAGMLFIGVVAVQAQEREQEQSYPQDTTVLPAMDSLRQQGQQEEGSVNLKDREMTIIKASEIPAPLQQTLQAPEYKGWDAPTTTIYKNTANDLFVIEIFDGTKGTTYRFDKNGKRIQDY